jgi:riboflavin kinase/FMN adenylyltransferase
MKIVRGVAPAALREVVDRPAITTLGVFDGLHLGHQAIVRTMVERARATGAVPTVVTFDPHPRQVLQPESAPPLLQTFPQKMDGLRQLGVGQVIVLTFDHALASLSAERFVEMILVEALASREVYLGAGFAFGYQRQGNIDRLLAWSEQYQFLAAEVPELQIRGHRVSSTLIRKLLQAGRVNLARRMLGRPYGMEGVVVRGEALGRRLLFPTANLAVENRVLPAEGVYITLTLVDGHWQRSVTNIGRRPTVSDETALRIETHLLDFDGDLYDQTLRLRFLHRLRGERKFSGIEALKAQIAQDRARAVRYFEAAAVQRHLRFR